MINAERKPIDFARSHSTGITDVGGVGQVSKGQTEAARNAGDQVVGIFGKENTALWKPGEVMTADEFIAYNKPGVPEDLRSIYSTLGLLEEGAGTAEEIEIADRAFQERIAPLRGAISDFLKGHNSKVVMLDNPSMPHQLALGQALLPMAEAGEISLVLLHHDAWPDKESFNRVGQSLRRSSTLQRLIQPHETVTHTVTGAYTRDRVAKMYGWDAAEAEKRLHIVPIGVSEQYVENKPVEHKGLDDVLERYNTGKDELRFLMASRLVRRKNFEGMMQVVAHLNKIGISTSFITTAGFPDKDPEYFQQLHELRESLGMENKFIFLSEETDDNGNLIDLSPNNLPLAMYQRAKGGYLFLSHEEGFSMTPDEAAMAGLFPLHLSDIGPHRRFGNAAFYHDSKGNPVQIAETIASAYQSIRDMGISAQDINDPHKAADILSRLSNVDQALFPYSYLSNFKQAGGTYNAIHINTLRPLLEQAMQQ